MDPSTMTGDEIVITGISGKFPNSENVKIFQENLLNMVDCVTNGDPRWTLGKSKIYTFLRQKSEDYYVFYNYYNSRNYIEHSLILLNAF